MFSIWGHGTGFSPLTDVPGKYEVSARQATRGVIGDEWNNKEQLNMYELRDAIHASGIDRLNTLFFHNCMMGNLETLASVNDCADYICCSAHVLRSNGEVMAEFVRGLVDKGNAKDAVAQMIERNTPIWQNEYKEEPMFIVTTPREKEGGESDVSFRMRSFLYLMGVRLSSVLRVCFVHIKPDSVAELCKTVFTKIRDVNSFTYVIDKSAAAYELCGFCRSAVFVHYLLYDLHVRLPLTKPGAEGVPQVVCGEIRKEQRLSLFSLRFGSLFFIIVCRDVVDRMIHFGRYRYRST